MNVCIFIVRMARPPKIQHTTSNINLEHNFSQDHRILGIKSYTFSEVGEPLKTNPAVNMLHGDHTHTYIYIHVYVCICAVYTHNYCIQHVGYDVHSTCIYAD